MRLPVYGYICLSCGQVWGWDDGYAKHFDPATGEKCRDVSGSSSVPIEMGPIAERPWGPEGIYAVLRWEATYDHGYWPGPRPEAVEMHMAEGRERIAAALRTTEQL